MADPATANADQKTEGRPPVAALKEMLRNLYDFCNQRSINTARLTRKVRALLKRITGPQGYLGQNWLFDYAANGYIYHARFGDMRNDPVLRAFYQVVCDAAPFLRPAKPERGREWSEEPLEPANMLGAIRELRGSLHGCLSRMGALPVPGPRAKRRHGHAMRGRDVVTSKSTTPAKRSTERGEGRAKCIAKLTEHHRYAHGGCLNLEPIKNNELARLAEVAQSTASAFFNKNFKGHAKYRGFCQDQGRLLAALKLLNDEFAPHVLMADSPRG
jgi:hypothetical protein